MTHHVANQNGLRPMRFGRAMHMDLSRASDADLDRAFRVLNDYDDAGKASAYTQDAIDDRIDDIFAEGDRRAGVTPAYVERKPRSFWHPATEPADADDRAIENSADQQELPAFPQEEVDEDAEADADEEADEAEAMADDPSVGGRVDPEDDAPDAEAREEARILSDVGGMTGEVPGESVPM